MQLETWTYFNGQWHKGSVPLMSSTTNAAWLGNTVFDGARYFEGVTPDIEHHCARVVDSALKLNMMPFLTADEIVGLVKAGCKKFSADKALYIRPMYWIEDGIGPIEPESTRFALVIQALPMPDPNTGINACLSTYQKPHPNTAPTTAKATCLYPHLTMAWGDAKKQGYDNAVMLDALGHVAEFTMQNLLYVKDAEVFTPKPNGMLLNGITRQRSLGLLQQLGYTIHEQTIEPQALLTADEIISTGNHGKIIPCVSYQNRKLPDDKVGKQLKEAYWDFAHSKTSLPLTQ